MPLGPDGFARRLRCPFCECLLPGSAIKAYIRSGTYSDDGSMGGRAWGEATVTIDCPTCHKAIFEKEYE